jgi:branched-chain amino acid transport system permease protein
MTDLEVILQQLVTGLSNGMIIALIALGYTMVFGIVELINFAHGDLFMLGCFLALTLLGATGLAGADPGSAASIWAIVLMFAVVPPFCGGLNWCIDRYAYRPLRSAPRLAPLVSALGVSFILLNIGLFWGGMPLEVFGFGNAAASPKDFPALLSSENLLGESNIFITFREVLVFAVTLPLLALLSYVVKYTTLGKSMRAVAQNPTAAKLMGIDVDRVIGRTFMIGGALGGAASVVHALTYNTVFFQMGFRVGIDAFTAAVLGGIGNLLGACLGGIAIGIIRALSDQYIATQWTNSVVFSILIVVLVFRPSGLLGARTREKV